MKNRILGNTGIDISEMGLGCWQLGNDFGPVQEKEATDILDTAVEQGITLFDTADVYGGGLSEERIGRWMKTRSSKPFIATKVGRGGDLYPDGYTKEKVKKSLAGSIKRLGVEVLDLAQLHCVSTEVLKDGDLLSWMEDFQDEGLIRFFGASVEMLDEALFCLGNRKLSSLQIIFNMFRHDAIEELLPKAAVNNVGIIVRLPLASGLLSGKMSKDRTFSEGDHRNYNRDGKFFHVGETFNGIPFEKAVELVDESKDFLPGQMTLHQMSLRWILDQPQVSTVIAGASRAEQVFSNAGISELKPLSRELHQSLSDFYYDRVRQHIRGGI